ncbi:hypothetical protein [Sediminimonas qiaohouensis]|uniref:hypothetical protein n=1 Tax=Sediminimonas qiaohouensis TaxID=552061 RepID=UPI000422D15A|nr:hypothetical protein [Sediminimonas qiaohouensis]
MSYRPTSRILHILAEETDDLSVIAQTLDQMIPDVIEKLPSGAHGAADLQRVDALCQHLKDISSTLKTMAVLIDAEAELEIATLINEVRLDYFKRRLRDDPVAPELGLGHGQIQLF